MPGLRTRARELNELELHDMIQKAMAILVGASYTMYDQAIAFTMHDAIMKKPSTASVDSLTERQRQLPRVEADISKSWVDWTMAAEGNWRWLIGRCNDLQQSYLRRFRKEPPLSLEFRRLCMSSIRPRGPGRTPFPLEPC